MPPRTAIPKARHPSTVTLEVRIVESHYLTTATCRTNANKATLRSKLCQAACDTLQYTYHASIYESKDASRCVACIRVQETGFGPGHWKRIGWTGTLEYRDWFDRNVLFGSEDTLRIELHFSTDASASAKPSSAVLTTREYLMLGDQATIGDKWMDEQKMWEPSTAYFFAGARVTLCGQRASLDTQVRTSHQFS